MGKVSRSVLMFAAALAAGCARHSGLRLPPRAPTPARAGAPRVDACARAASGGACDAAEGDPTMAIDASWPTTVVKGRIESQRRQAVDCDGAEVLLAPVPTRALVRTVALAPADSIGAELAAGVAAVEILNPRSCTIVRVERAAAAGETTAIWSQLWANGALHLTVTDDILLHQTGAVLVRDGLNPLEIRFVSSRGEVLATRHLGVRVDVERPIVPGHDQPRRTPECN